MALYCSPADKGKQYSGKFFGPSGFATECCLQKPVRVRKQREDLAEREIRCTFAVHGGMAERSIAAVLKTVELQGSGGSNPSSSATSGCENARSPKRPGCGEENERAAKSGKPVCRYPIPYSARYARGGAMQQRIRAGLTASSVTCPLPARNIFRIIWRSRGGKTRNTTLRSACNMPEESPGSRKTRSVARRSPIPCPTARKADAFPAGCRDDARLQSAAQPRTMFRARPETPRKRMKNAVRGFSNALPAAARERSRRG